MSHGGPRPGAGRKPGASTKLNEEARKQAADGGLMPLDYMLGIMRDDGNAPQERFEAAKAAAPYVHARLSSVEQRGEFTVQNVVALPETAESVDEWKASVSTRQ